MPNAEQLAQDVIFLQGEVDHLRQEADQQEVEEHLLNLRRGDETGNSSHVTVMDTSEERRAEAENYPESPAGGNGEESNEPALQDNGASTINGLSGAGSDIA